MKIFRVQTPNGDILHATQIEGVTRVLDGDIFGDLTVGELAVSERILSDFELLAPVVPSCIIGIGLNYRQHAVESGAPIPNFPIVFLKFPGTVCGEGAPIRLPLQMKSEAVDYECELAVILGRACKNATRETALDFVAGYTCANDISARDWQIHRGGSQWSRGKSFDTFCPLGPCFVTKDEIPNPNNLALKTILNGETVQYWNTRDMIFDVPSLIEFLSCDTTLPRGTVILTGTPQGVGMARNPPLYLKGGDHVCVEIENIGTLSNPVEASES